MCDEGLGHAAAIPTKETLTLTSEHLRSFHVPQSPSIQPVHVHPRSPRSMHRQRCRWYAGKRSSRPIPPSRTSPGRSVTGITPWQSKWPNEILLATLLGTSAFAASQPPPKQLGAAALAIKLRTQISHGLSKITSKIPGPCLRGALRKKPPACRRLVQTQSHFTSDH